MASRVWISGDPQTALLPVTAADLLPADHLAFRLQALLGALDLSRFEAVYRADGRGRAPFDPKMMLTLILYCRAKRLISGRGGGRCLPRRPGGVAAGDAAVGRR